MLHLFVIAALFVNQIFGHMCLLAPYQRLPVNDTQLSNPGADECALTTAPCGGVSAKGINAGIMSETYTVIMEKNLDHYNNDTKNPGNFTVSLWTSGGEFIRELGSVMDDARPSGSIYQVEFPIPHEGGESKFIIQAAYYTKNTNAPAAFYQCADIEIYPRN